MKQTETDQQVALLPQAVVSHKRRETYDTHLSINRESASGLHQCSCPRTKLGNRPGRYWENSTTLFDGHIVTLFEFSAGTDTD